MRTFKLSSNKTWNHTKFIYVTVEKMSLNNIYFNTVNRALHVLRSKCTGKIKNYLCIQRLTSEKYLCSKKHNSNHYNIHPSWDSDDCSTVVASAATPRCAALWLDPSTLRWPLPGPVTPPRPLLDPLPLLVGPERGSRGAGWMWVVVPSPCPRDGPGTPSTLTCKTHQH